MRHLENVRLGLEFELQFFSAQQTAIRQILQEALEPIRFAMDPTRFPAHNREVNQLTHKYKTATAKLINLHINTEINLHINTRPVHERRALRLGEWGTGQ
jgi:hypothetical protein